MTWMLRGAISTLLLWTLAVSAAVADPRIFIGPIQYSGPATFEGQIIWVDAAALAKEVGWKLDGSNLHDARPASAVAAGPGFQVNGRLFDGQTRVEGDHQWVSLTDLARFLGGHGRVDLIVGLVQCQIPGMPASSGPNPAEVLMSQIHSMPFTLVYFYAPGDVYSQHLGPHVRKFIGAHAGQVRLVEYDITHAGDNWIYTRYKTPSNGIPEVVLLNREGKVLQKLLGETNQAGLEKELGSLINP